METAATQTQERPDADTARMSVAQSGGRDARTPKMGRYMTIPVFLARRDVEMLEAALVNLVKQGRDVSRSRLIAEAIRRHLADGGQSKTKVRG
jgi:hypothetical protein